VRLELTLFHLDFTNQIVEPSASAGSVAQAALANQGATRHRGLEAGLQVDWATALALPFRVETGLNYTFTDAEFSRDRFLVRAPGDTVNIRGNRLPYAPRHLVSASMEVATPSEGAGLRVDALRVGAQFADNFETAAPSATGRNGRIPAYGMLNLSGWWTVPVGVRVVGSVKNLGNATYIASRRPEGIKPGLPRLVQLGVELGF
jgi:Fe(3+) dicitrate transport protein